MVVRATFRIPAELLRTAKAVAALRGETISVVLRRCLLEYVARGKKELKELQTEE